MYHSSYRRRAREKMQPSPLKPVPDDKVEDKKPNDRTVSTESKNEVESSFERQARIVKEQMRIFIMRLREREEERRQKIEQAQQPPPIQSDQASEQTLVPAVTQQDPIVLLEMPIDDTDVDLPEPTDLESYLQAFDGERKTIFRSMFMYAYPNACPHISGQRDQISVSPSSGYWRRRFDSTARENSTT